MWNQWSFRKRKGLRAEDTQECIDRLAAIFGHCLVDPSGMHRWNLDTRRCDHCNEPFPHTETSHIVGGA